MKRIVNGLLAIVLIVQTLSVAGCSSGGAKSLQILDSGGEEIAFLQTVSDARTELTDSAYRAYLEAVLSECEILIAEQNNCDVKKARKFLLEMSARFIPRWTVGFFHRCKRRMNSRIKKTFRSAVP